MTLTFQMPGQNGPVDGYRLVHLEVQNFGFYHGLHSFTISPPEGVVFTGENGAGKSTALDALRILLFEQPAFNSASSEMKRARNVESYYLGTFGEGEDKLEGGGFARRRKILRDYGSPIGATAILARFATRGGQELTLARLLHMPKAQTYNWRNIVCDAHLGMNEILPFDTVRNTQRKIARPGSLITDNIGTYFHRVATSFGFKDRTTARPAFQMLEKAIGAKAINSLESFAQDHIFPIGNLADVCGAVSKSLRAVKDILDELDTDRQKVEKLTKITNSFDVIEKNEALHADAVELARYSDAFEHILEALRWSAHSSDMTKSLAPLLAEKSRIEALIARLTSEIPSLEIAYRNAGGDRIDALQSALGEAQAQLNERIALRTPFEEAIQTAGSVICRKILPHGQACRAKSWVRSKPAPSRQHNRKPQPRPSLKISV